MGLDQTGFSPRVQQKVVHAGVNSASYQQASRDLAELSDLTVGPKPIERLVHRIGLERIDHRAAAVDAHQALPLMDKDGIADSERPCAPVAMVSIDGGRLQVRATSPRKPVPESKPKPESTPDSESTPEPLASTPEPALESKPEPELESKPALEARPEPALEAKPEPERSSHWRESKVAVLETYLGQPSQADPDPDVPRCFLDLAGAAKIVRGLGHPMPVGLDFKDDGADMTQGEPAEPRRDRKERPGRPERLVRSVLASRACSDDFGPMVHQAAWERNFFGAQQKVFLGDGLPTNWTIQRRHFALFKPILDFVHALSYIFAAAFAGRSQAEGAVIFRRWIQTAWAGAVATILPELEAQSAALGAPPPGCTDSDPRKLVFEALRYLRNNECRMRYDEYRRLGLPIMTSAVESMIKQINRRVKGSEKFWSEPGAEAILQLRADYLSETEPMTQFWVDREAQAKIGRRYRTAA